MKGVVVYDSYYGNTKLVAEAIVEQIRAQGHEAELRNVKEKWAMPLQGDFLFVGSPVRMGRVTAATKRVVKRLDRESWRNKPIVVFTTVARMPGPNPTEKERHSYDKWALAAGLKLRDLAKDRGLNVIDKVLYVEVKDAKGPLVDNGIEQTKAFAHDFLLALPK